jgi:hypothetical protein
MASYRSDRVFTTSSSSQVPMLRWHGTSPVYAPLLPFVGVLYTLMTIESSLG